MQSVEVGAQADRPLARPPAPQRGDNARLGDPMRDLEAPAAQAVGDQPGRALFLEADFRMAMNVAADRDHVRLVTLQFLNYRKIHRLRPSMRLIAGDSRTPAFPAKQSSGRVSPVRLLLFGGARKRRA
jgi:hypothetical protein